MMRLILALTMVIRTMADPFTTDDCVATLDAGHPFCLYMLRFQKTYTESTWKDRKAALDDSVEFIRQHNANRSDYSLRLTPMSDMTVHEYRKTRLTERVNHRVAHRLRSGQHLRKTVDLDTLPESWDLREHGHIAKPVYQGECGSCFAIVAGEMLDWWARKLTDRDHPTASMQQLMDCASEAYPDDAEYCEGSVMEFPLRYAAKHRIWSNDDYPYTGAAGTCRHDTPPDMSFRPQYMHHTDVYQEPDLEAVLKYYIYNYGPVGVSFDASDRKFQHLGSGIYSGNRECSDTDVNHAVLLVGYTPEYYIVKNSWGTGFGDGGYFKLKRGAHMCGLLEVVSIILSGDMA